MPYQEDFQHVDLASLERINRGQLPGLQILHERLARDFRQELSTLLERNCSVNLQEVSTTDFGRYRKQLASPTSMHFFRLPPLRGQAMLSISSSLVSAIVDCMFGGKAEKQRSKRNAELTPLESRLIGKIVLRTLDILRDAWAPLMRVDTVYVCSEQNPLAASLCPTSDKVAVAAFSAEIGKQSGDFSFCYPLSLLEPVKSKLKSDSQSERLLEEQNIDTEQMTQTLQQVEVTLRVSLAQGPILGRDLLHLKAGDIIPLNTPADDKAIVLVGGKAKFEGVVGSHHGQRAVRIINRIGRS